MTNYQNGDNIKLLIIKTLIKGGENMFPNLQAEQARKKMTNQQVANYLGISRRTYEQKKQSGRFLAIECNYLCTLFQCEFAYLFAVDTQKTA